MGRRVGGGSHHGGTPLDTNVLIALVVADHLHHDAAEAWFIGSDDTFATCPLNAVLGHRQVTDSYLAQLTRAQHGRLATFDQGLAKLHTDIADLLPTIPPQPSP